MTVAASGEDEVARLAQEWKTLVESIEPPVRIGIAQTCELHATELAECFYAVLLSHPEAQRYLSHEIVNARLRKSLRNWLHSLFIVESGDTGEQVIALQRHIGAMHARIGVGHQLVLRGARVLKREFAQRVPPGPVEMKIVLAAAERIDFAMEVITAEYVSASGRNVRTDESYRVFAQTANMSLERERQRSTLLDWQSKLLQSMLWAIPGDKLQSLESSPFGLWLQHKAPGVFRSASELRAMVEVVHRIDHTLLPLCNRELGRPESEEARRLVREVLRELDQIRYGFEHLFEQLVDIEAGRDVLTQLLNRRFLPGVLSREMDFCATSKRQFAVMLADIDNFKRVNDTHGHTGGDRVLQQVAAALNNSIRAGDFLFRYGGEEFLIVAVEVNQTTAMEFADDLRKSVEHQRCLLNQGESVQMTVSLGVAVFDGHPDYERLIDQADRALFRAKQSGRNCCVLAQA